jgi:hypothetical protein
MCKRRRVVSVHGDKTRLALQALGYGYGVVEEEP